MSCSRPNQISTTSSICRVRVDNDPIQMLWLCREQMAGGGGELELVSANPKRKKQMGKEMQLTSIVPSRLLAIAW